MDVLLTMSEDLLFTWVWTDETLDEWETVIVRQGMRTANSARAVTDAVRKYFGKYRIDESLYRGKELETFSPDPGDRLHAAACIYGDVDVLLTRNLKDFQTAAIVQAGVKVMTADAFLCDLLQVHRQAVVESFTRAANTRKNPPTTVGKFADVVAAAGAPRFARMFKGVS